MGYRSAQVIIEAATEAELLINSLMKGEKYDVGQAAAAIILSGEKGRLGPSTAAIAAAAGSRNIPVNRIGCEDLLVLGYGCKQKKSLDYY